MEDIEARLNQWREGLLSDAEIMAYLIQEQAMNLARIEEVRQSMLARETEIAEGRIVSIFGKAEARKEQFKFKGIPQVDPNNGL